MLKEEQQVALDAINVDSSNRKLLDKYHKVTERVEANSAKLEKRIQ